MESKNIVRHLFTVGFGAVINVVLGLITTPLITRLVDPIEYGQLSIFNTYSGMILSFLYFGLDYALIRFFYNDDSIKKRSEILKLCILLPTFAAVIVFVIYYVLIKIGILNFRFNDFIFILLFINVLVSIFEKISTTLLRSVFKSKEYSLCVILQKIAYCIVIVVGCFVLKSHYLEILIVAITGSLLVTSIMSALFTKEYWNFKSVSFPDNKIEIIKYGLPFIIFAVALTLLDSVDKLFIDYYCTDYEVGIYTSAFTLVALFAMVQTTFNKIWIPAQTEQFVKNPDDKSFIKNGNTYITIIMFFLTINTILFKDVFCLMLGPQYRSASFYIPFLLIESSMYTISDTMCSGIEYAKKSYLNIVVSIFPCLLSIAMQLTLIPVIGAKGASIARSGASILYLFLRTMYSNRYYYVNYEISKLVMILIVAIVFATVGTFSSNNHYITITYSASMLVFLVLYHKETIEMLKYFKKSILYK